jgi:hypothetical protein
MRVPRTIRERYGFMKNPEAQRGMEKAGFKTYRAA